MIRPVKYSRQGFTLIDRRVAKRGFTLIELSIVLLIIGLITGGVLVGRDLISVAGARAQISQIEKYQTAVNTFRGKYGYLPGDIPDPVASQYGFRARGPAPGQGDGNAMIEAAAVFAGNTAGSVVFAGEEQMFWVDLTDAKLLDGGFSQYNILAASPSVTPTQVGLYLPAAKIGEGNYIDVWNGGPFEWWMGDNAGTDHINYFGLSKVIGDNGFGQASANTALTVQQAYNIDKKIDDGLPQSGTVTAMIPTVSSWGVPISWAVGASNQDWGMLNIGDVDSDTFGPLTPQTTNPIYAHRDEGVAFSDTCYNNGDTLQPEHYSMEYNNGNGPNCGLSFKFQ